MSKLDFKTIADTIEDREELEGVLRSVYDQGYNQRAIDDKESYIKEYEGNTLCPGNYGGTEES